MSQVTWQLLWANNKGKKMTERIFTMGVTIFICLIVGVCFDIEGGRYIQQIGLFWAGAVFGALLLGANDVDGK